METILSIITLIVGVIAIGVLNHHDGTSDPRRYAPLEDDDKK